MVPKRPPWWGRLLLEVDRKPVKDVKEFASIVDKKKSGEKILLRLQSSQGGYKIVLFSIP